LGTLAWQDLAQERARETFSRSPGCGAKIARRFGVPFFAKPLDLQALRTAALDAPR
jgi:hypothetical protein